MLDCVLLEMKDDNKHKGNSQKAFMYDRRFLSVKLNLCSRNNVHENNHEQRTSTFFHHCLKMSFSKVRNVFKLCKGLFFVNVEIDDNHSRL